MFSPMTPMINKITWFSKFDGLDFSFILAVISLIIIYIIWHYTKIGY